ncbi:MAG: STAS domain-containing protein [Alphaproteobacteria bacterium]|nr:STAS domain-containing protein [Alphaproteobacteria bacterium]
MKTPGPLVIADQADGAPAAREAYQPENLPEGVALYRITGALFFGSAASLAIALDKILAGQKKLVLDFSGATFVDSTGAQAIKSFTDKAVRQGVSVVISGASIEARRALAAGGVSPAKIRYEPTLAAALAAAGPA